MECVCDQPGPATKRCPLHEVVEIGDEITVPDAADAAIEQHVPNRCICYEPGPAHQMCLLHEMDAFDANEVIGELNDDFLDILANMNFDDNNTPIVNISQPANNINVIRNPLIEVDIQHLIAANRADIEQHNCGQLDQICPHCRAKFFRYERNSRGM
ncbi:hypothetical protein QE152_g40618 [Popillia japonica]|uniref:Uncharacterized protein n=1 Tax=Popillia japonica TaxID=7064 RepID=A0AAW1HFM1_POPJA